MTGSSGSSGLMQTNLDVQPPPVGTQAGSLVRGGLKLAVIHPQRLQAEGRTLWEGQRQITRIKSPPVLCLCTSVSGGAGAENHNNSLGEQTHGRRSNSSKFCGTVLISSAGIWRAPFPKHAAECEQALGVIRAPRSKAKRHPAETKVTAAGHSAALGAGQDLPINPEHFSYWQDRTEPSFI